MNWLDFKTKYTASQMFELFFFPYSWKCIEEYLKRTNY